MEIILGGSRSGICLVSPEDFPFLSQHKWHMNYYGYVVGYFNKRCTVIHRVITNCPSDKIVDHINGDKLDNRRENLRICTRKDNCSNRKPHIGKTTSSYRCVFFDSRRNHYYSQKVVNGKLYYIGKFKTEVEAAEAYDRFVIENKISSHLNFPDKNYEQVEPPQKYIGVFYRQNTGKYFAKIYMNGKYVYILTSKNREECANAYDEYIVKNKIPGKRLNYPEKYTHIYDKGIRENTKKKELIIKTQKQNINDTDIRLLINNDDKVVKVSLVDYNKIKYHRCRICPRSGYVKIDVTDKITTTLHRFLLDVKDSNIYVDHINGNKLDNRRENLRLSNAKLNSNNKIKLQNRSSIYIGVYKQGSKWISEVTQNYKRYRAGTFEIEEHAGRARDLYILRHFPELHYKLNFKWSSEDMGKWIELLNSNSSTLTL